jgi:hypothetical protein
MRKNYDFSSAVRNPRDILARFVPFSDSSKFVINTIHTVSVTNTAIVLEGACFAVGR